MMTLAVVAEVVAVVGVVLCAPSVYRRFRPRPAPPVAVEAEDAEPVTGAFAYDNGVTTEDRPRP
jgi:hypothetical protein